MNTIITIGNSAFPLWLPFFIWFFLTLAAHHTNQVWDEKLDGYRLANTWEALGIMWEERIGVLFSFTLVAACLYFLDNWL